jgi:hypothetical protein
MVHLMRQNVPLVLFFAAAANSDCEVKSLAVSHRAALTKTRTYPITTVVKQSTFSHAKIVEVDNTHDALFRHAIITTSISKRANATVSVTPTAGADAVRTSTPSREWISSILDTVVMALLGLASIVVAVILGRRQLRAMGVQLQLMFDIARRHPDSNHVAMNDLERGQRVSDPDGDRIEARSEISRVGPAAQQADLSNGFTGFIPDPQPHVVGDDLQAQLVRDDEPACIQPERPTGGDDSPHDEVEQHEDEGQTLEDTSTASSCSQFDRQDSNDLNLDGPKALHLDDRELHIFMRADLNIH